MHNYTALSLNQFFRDIHGSINVIVRIRSKKFLRVMLPGFLRVIIYKSPYIHGNYCCLR